MGPKKNPPSKPTIVSEFQSFVGENSSRVVKKKLTPCVGNIDFKNPGNSVLYWTGDCKFNNELKLTLFMLNRMRTELNLTNLQFEPFIYVTNDDNKIVKAQVTGVDIEVEKNMFSDLDVYIITKVSDTDFSLHNFEDTQVLNPEENYNPSDIKNVFLTVLASVVHFVQKKDAFLQIVADDILPHGFQNGKFVELSDDNDAQRSLKEKMNVYLNFLSEDTVPFSFLLNWLLVTLLFSVLHFAAKTLKSKDCEFNEYGHLFDVVKNIDFEHPLNSIVYVYEGELKRLAAIEEEIGDGILTVGSLFKRIENVFTDEEEEETDETTWKFSYYFPFVNKRNQEQSHEFNVELYTAKCKYPTCQEKVPFGHPYCRMHLKSEAKLCLNNNISMGEIENGLKTYHYHNGVTACDGSKGPQDVVFEPGNLIVRAKGHKEPNESMQKRYDFTEGLVNGKKYIPYAFSYTDPETKQQVWVDGAIVRGVAFMIRQFDEKHPENVKIVLVRQNGKKKLWVQATRPIRNGEELFINFPHRTDELTKAARDAEYEQSTYNAELQKDEEQMAEFMEETDAERQALLSLRDVEDKISPETAVLLTAPDTSIVKRLGSKTGRTTLLGTQVEQEEELMHLTEEEKYELDVKNAITKQSLLLDEPNIVEPDELLREINTVEATFANRIRKLEGYNKVRKIRNEKPLTYFDDLHYPDLQAKTEEVLQKIETKRVEYNDPTYLNDVYNRLKKYITRE